MSNKSFSWHILQIHMWVSITPRHFWCTRANATYSISDFGVQLYAHDNIMALKSLNHFSIYIF